MVMLLMVRHLLHVLPGLLLPLVLPDLPDLLLQHHEDLQPRQVRKYQRLKNTTLSEVGFDTSLAYMLVSRHSHLLSI